MYDFENASKRLIFKNISKHLLDDLKQLYSKEKNKNGIIF